MRITYRKRLPPPTVAFKTKKRYVRSRNRNIINEAKSSI